MLSDWALYINVFYLNSYNFKAIRLDARQLPDLKKNIFVDQFRTNNLTSVANRWWRWWSWGWRSSPCVGCRSTFVSSPRGKCDEINVTSYIQKLYLGIYWLAMSNSMFNPIIYCWKNSKYQNIRLFRQEALSTIDESPLVCPDCLLRKIRRSMYKLLGPVTSAIAVIK